MNKNAQRKAAKRCISLMLSLFIAVFLIPPKAHLADARASGVNLGSVGNGAPALAPTVTPSAPAPRQVVLKE